LTCVLLSSPAMRTGRSPCRRYRQGDRGVRLRIFSRRTQMQRPIRHGGGGAPHPMGPPKPRPPKPGPPKPRPSTPRPPKLRPSKPRPPNPGPRPPGPPQWTSCACWATLGAVCGVVAASAAPASPIAEKLSAPAIAPIPTILFRVMTIPFLCIAIDWNFLFVVHQKTLGSVAMKALCVGPGAFMRRYTIAREVVSPLATKRPVLVAMGRRAAPPAPAAAAPAAVH
jgi:hypothetical protein